MEGRTRRLVSLPLEPEQEQEILRRLDTAGIAHKETRSMSRFFGSNAIWVPDAEYLRAKDILDRQAAEYAGVKREQWQAEWQREHGGSYARWLLHRVRRATIDDVLRVLALIALVGLMLLYPIAILR